MYKTAVTGLIKKAGKAVVDKVTDPKTLQKLAQQGTSAGTKLMLGGKGKKKKKATRPVHVIVTRRRRIHV